MKEREQTFLYHSYQPGRVMEALSTGTDFVGRELVIFCLKEKNDDILGYRQDGCFPQLQPAMQTSLQGPGYLHCNQKGMPCFSLRQSDNNSMLAW